LDHCFVADFRQRGKLVEIISLAVLRRDIRIIISRLSDALPISGYIPTSGYITVSTIERFDLENMGMGVGISVIGATEL